MTFGDVLDRNNGFGPGFDFLRVALAFAVLGWHALGIATGNFSYQESSPIWIYNHCVLPMFFALSGFLIAGSAQRLAFHSFFINRSLRILPALAVEIFLSAVFLGLLFTTLSPGEYFTDPKFRTYFLNIFGWVHYELPGVFETNPIPAIVNHSLWTVPFEMACYVLMAVIILTRALRWPWVLLGSVFFYIVAAAFVQYLAEDVDSHPRWLRLAVYVTQGLGRFIYGRNLYLIPSFCFGLIFFALRHRIPYSHKLAAVLVLGIVIVGFLGNGEWTDFGLFALVAIPTFAYLAVYVGLSRIPPMPFFSGGDYSYGIYLYGYPIQQALVAAIPVDMPWPVLLVLSALATTLFAYVSWHYVEKPILRFRRSFAVLAREREKPAH